MNKMTPFLEGFNHLAKSVENLLFVTRSKKLQKQAISDLKKIYKEAAKEKIIAIKDNNEEYANTILGCECVISALSSFIEMWLLIKDDEPDKAWDKLISAQRFTLAAIRASDGFQHLKSLFTYLRSIENNVFPPQTFLSSGMIVEEQICSICNKNYEECEHLVNLPYMGEFCYIKLGKIKLDHAAIVNNPGDKRCRVISFDDGEVSRNKMTWEETPSKSHEGEGNAINAILLRAN